MAPGRARELRVEAARRALERQAVELAELLEGRPGLPARQARATVVLDAAHELGAALLEERRR